MASSSKSSSTRLALLLRLSLLCAVALLISPAWSLTCSSQKFKNNELYAHCLDLPTLSSYLHWTYDSSNSSISVAFIAPPPSSSGWISWAINPTQPRMLGAQALVAFKHSNGSMVVQTYNIQSYAIKESELKLQVWDKSAEYSDGVIRLFAKMKVPSNSEKVNQVWQVGPVTDDVPERHDMQAPNLNAVDTLSLSGAQPGTTPTGVDSRTKKKNIHGVLNAVSWGILFPMGVIISRYLRTFKSADPAWFYLHVTCQVSAYAIGVAGWGTGMKLGSESKGFQYTGHRNIGITLFCFATVQLFALFLRPKKDHKYRFYWNIYHHGLGYAILVLGILNVFKGLDILEPEKKWKSAYIIVIGVLGAIALLLEAITWVVVLRRKSRKSTKPYDGFNNGQGRQQQPLAI